jgi:hypothetical protein
MFNIRTLVLSSILAGVIMLIVGLLTVGTEVISNTSSNPDVISAVEEEPANLNSAINTPPYRSQFGKCYDVAISDLAACREASQSSAQIERPPLDECYDVSIWDLAACRNTSQASIP